MAVNGSQHMTDLSALADTQFEFAALYSWGGENGELTALGTCLGGLLVMLGWRGELRHLEEVRPHLQPVDTLDDMRVVLLRLGYSTKVYKGLASTTFDNLLPYIFIDATGKPLLVCERNSDGSFLALNGETRNFQNAWLDKTPGTLVFADDANEADLDGDIAKYGWFSYVSSQFRGLFLRIFGLTLLTNLSNLLVPLFIMVVYDNIALTKSAEFLGYLAAGICVALLFDMFLRHLRGRALAYLGARIDALVTVQAFKHLITLPVSMTSNSPISAQLSKIKQFESIGETIVGRLATSLFDMPFLILFMAAIWVVAGAIVWIPASLIVIYVLLAVVTIPILNRRTSRAGEKQAAQQQFLIEMLASQRAIKEAQCEDVWRERFSRMTRETLAMQFQVRQFNRLIEVLAQVLATICGAATLLVGALLVMKGDLTIGALIAVMALVWRVLSPVQATFVNFNHIGRLRQYIRQFDNLMRMKVERRSASSRTEFRRFRGDLRIERLSFRRNQTSEACLVNIALTLKPGEIVAITGPSGAGKSTLLEMVAGLHTPQAGVVSIDGLDIRQLDTVELRNGLAVVPQNIQFFYGTVLQNIRLAAPGASDETVRQALLDAGLSPTLNELPEGVQTRLTHDMVEKLPQGLMQRLNLARAYAKKAGVLLLDVPAQGLDKDGDQALVAKLAALRGQCSVLMVTHRPDHMRLADRLIYMDRGVILAQGAPEKVLQALARAA